MGNPSSTEHRSPKNTLEHTQRRLALGNCCAMMMLFAQVVDGGAPTQWHSTSPPCSFPTLLLPCTPLFDYTRLQMRRPVQNGHPPQSQPPTAAVEIFAQFEFQPLPPSPPLVWGTPLLIWLEIKKHLNGISLASPAAAAAAAAKIGMINVLVFVILFIVQISPKKNEEKLFKFYRMYKTHFL